MAIIIWLVLHFHIALMVRIQGCLTQLRTGTVCRLPAQWLRRSRRNNRVDGNKEGPKPSMANAPMPANPD